MLKCISSVYILKKHIPQCIRSVYAQMHRQNDVGIYLYSPESVGIYLGIRPNLKKGRKFMVKLLLTYGITSMV